MSSSYSARSRAPLTNQFLNPISPSGRLYCSSSAISPTKASSSFSTRSSSVFPNSVSQNSVNLIGLSSRDHVTRTSIPASSHRKTCMCSPTTHPGSFRCKLHKGKRIHPSAAVSSPSNRLNARRSAMTNSLVRIGTVEGDLVKRALAALIRPSSHQQRRRIDFHPRPSRLSKMYTADDQ